MPDLHLDAVHAFWDSYDRQTLYRIVVALSEVEHWTIDQDPVIEPKMLHLGSVIDHMSDDVEITDEAKIIRILANTTVSRAISILQALDGAKPGTAVQLLTYAEEASKEDGASFDRHAKLFLRRNLVFERMQLLGRVFAPQRISLILRALGQSNENK